MTPLTTAARRFPLRRLLLALVALVLPAVTQARPNVLLICVDDLRPELGSYGVDYISSPNIDALAERGRVFRRHYVQAPTCGSSRYALLTGRYGPASNQALFRRAERMEKDADAVAPSLPGWFREHGYTTVSVGKVSHHPGGWGGRDWDDESKPEMPGAWDRHLLPAGPWRHPRGAMHGLAHGEIRKKAKDMDVLQAEPGPDTIYPDGLIAEEALGQLDTLAGERDENPFFLAVGIIRPHLPFGAPAKYLEPYRGVEMPPIPHPGKPGRPSTWHGSGEFMKYNRWGRDPNEDADFAAEVRRHYAACVSYADALVGKVLDRLDAVGAADDTIVLLWGDHGWHLGEHAVWGKHTLFEESLRSPLIVHHPGIDRPGEGSDAIVETVDIFPTVCELVGLPEPETLHGDSLGPVLEDPAAEGPPAFGYWRGLETLRTDRYRVIAGDEGPRELYDHDRPHAETQNVLDEHPDVAERLVQELEARAALRSDG